MANRAWAWQQLRQAAMQEVRAPDSLQGNRQPSTPLTIAWANGESPHRCAAPSPDNAEQRIRAKLWPARNRELAGIAAACISLPTEVSSRRHQSPCPP